MSTRKEITAIQAIQAIQEGWIVSDSDDNLYFLDSVGSIVSTSESGVIVNLKFFPLTIKFRKISARKGITHG